MTRKYQHKDIKYITEPNLGILTTSVLHTSDPNALLPTLSALQVLWYA